MIGQSFPTFQCRTFRTVIVIPTAQRRPDNPNKDKRQGDKQNHKRHYKGQIQRYFRPKALEQIAVYKHFPISDKFDFYVFPILRKRNRPHRYPGSVWKRRQLRHRRRDSVQTIRKRKKIRYGNYKIPHRTKQPRKTRREICCRTIQTEPRDNHTQNMTDFYLPAEFQPPFYTSYHIRYSTSLPLS